MGALVINLPGRLLVAPLPAAQPTIHIRPRSRKDLARVSTLINAHTARWLRGQGLSEADFQRRVLAAYEEAEAKNKVVGQ